MLKEFAFTPHIFDPNAAPNNPNWRRCIEKIIDRVFYPGAVPPLVISGLCWEEDACGWETITKALIDKIENENTRRLSQSLFTQVAKHLVRRTPGENWPGDEEAGWGEEAAIAHRIESLDRILAQVAENVPSDAPRQPLSAVSNSDFWNIINTEVQAPKNVADAVEPLRLILRYSDTIVLSMPYENCEEFTIECIRRACNRPRGTKPPTIILHRKAPANVDAKVKWMKSKLADMNRAPDSKVYMWREPYRERLVIGCRVAELGGGHQKLAVRWGAFISHVWGEGNSLNEPPPTYTLIPITKASQHLNLLGTQSKELAYAPLQL